MSEASIRERVVGTFVIAAYAMRRTFVFSGRSRRTELLCYWAVSALLAAVVNGAASAVGGREAANGIEVALGALVVLPLFGLVVRRFHDMGFTGLLALPMLPTAVMGTYKDYWYRFTPPDLMIQGYPFDGTMGILVIPGVIIVFWALIHPGCVGEDNRFGPDPRFQSIRAQSDPAVA